MRNYYQILGVAERAAADEIKHAYRQLVRRLHPDVGGTGTAVSFHEVQRAYETLSDHERRRDYDARLAAGRRPARRSSPAEDWQADEVAIDYPSLASVIERMRRSVFEEPPRRTLSADILLSPREAHYGAEVPLEIPLQATCGGCGGRGETWTEVCLGCGGSGEALFTRLIRFAVPPGVADGARFRLSVGTDFAPPTFVEVRILVDR